MLGLPDAYVLRARIAPVIIAVLPLVLLFFSNLMSAEIVELSLSGLITIAFLTFLAQIGRDRGKKIEESLFLSWGGKPTTLFLRHRNKSLNSEVKKKIHARLSDQAGIELPTSEVEANNPEAADEKYDAAVHWLRQNTQDQKVFPRVFEENVSYGFRRNLLGLKPFVLLICVTTIVYQAAKKFEFQFLDILASFTTIPSAVSFVLVFFMLLFVKRSWVKVAGENYAAALLNCVENKKI